MSDWAQLSKVRPKRGKKKPRPWVVEERYTDEYIAEMSSWGRPELWVNDEWRFKSSHSIKEIAESAMSILESQYTGNYVQFRIRNTEEQ